MSAAYDVLMHEQMSACTCVRGLRHVRVIVPHSDPPSFHAQVKQDMHLLSSVDTQQLSSLPSDWPRGSGPVVRVSGADQLMFICGTESWGGVNVKCLLTDCLLLQDIYNNTIYFGRD